MVDNSNIYERLKVLDIHLPEPIIRPTNWKLKPFKISNNLLFLSGHGPRVGSEVAMNGRLGDGYDIEYGKRAARLCMLNLLKTTEIALGDLNRIKSIIKVFGMVKCTLDFNNQPEVIDGASELLIEIFGERGEHARTAVGMYDLPRGISVEIEMILEFNKSL